MKEGIEKNPLWLLWQTLNLLGVLETEKLLTEAATSCAIAALNEGRIMVRPKLRTLSSCCAERTSLSRKFMHGLPALPKADAGCVRHLETLTLIVLASN